MPIIVSKNKDSLDRYIDKPEHYFHGIIKMIERLFQIDFTLRFQNMTFRGCITDKGVSKYCFKIAMLLN